MLLSDALVERASKYSGAAARTVNTGNTFGSRLRHFDSSAPRAYRNGSVAAFGSDERVTNLTQLIDGQHAKRSGFPRGRSPVFPLDTGASCAPPSVEGRLGLLPVRAIRRRKR